MRFISVLGVLLLAACSSLYSPVRGRVVDGEGRPVPGAVVQLAPFPSMTSESVRQLVTDADGKFEGEFKFMSYKSPQLGMAVERERRLGSAIWFNRNGESVSVVVEPLARVKGRVSYAKVPKPVREQRFRHTFSVINIGKPSPLQFPSWVGQRFDWIMGGPLEEGAFEFLLPPGKYSAQVSGMHGGIQCEFSVEESLVEVDLGLLEPPPMPGHEIYGTPAPELRFADTRGIAREGGLAALKGKWVLLFFWDHRMKLNTHWLPALIAFYKEHPELRDRMEVVGVHNCDDVLTLSELRFAQIVGTGESYVDEIPFPVGIDDDEKTFRSYGLARGSWRLSPHYYLITPEGTVDFIPWVVKFTDLLKAKLGVN